jgi:hypothetical protein
MTKEIGRLQSFGLGFEATRGTAVSASDWIPVESGSLTHTIEKVKDTSGFGIIDEISDSHITKETSELSVDGIARSQSIGHLLKLALGTAGTATLVETGVYSHAFTRLNTNQHPTITAYLNNGTADERAPFHILDSLSINTVVGDYVKFSASTMGSKIESTSATPSFATGNTDEQFLASKAVVKFASNIAGLSGASAVPLQSINLTISKNPEQIMAVGSTTVNDAVNQQFGVAGDFEMVHDGNTYRDLFTANTKRAIQIEITGSVLIGATQYSKLIIQVAQAGLDSWERSDDNNAIIRETVGFTAEYSFGDTQTMNVFLQNKKSTNY